MISAIQKTSRNTSFLVSRVRALTNKVDVDHYRGDWKQYGDIENYHPEKFQIKTFNKISKLGLGEFPTDTYDIRSQEVDAKNAHAILLRSYKIQEDEVPLTCRAVARCGAGTNNVPVARMTELGIPVFNTPGANANAVKELVVCGLLLGSRKIVDGIVHMKDLGRQGLAKERVEKDKALFGGREIKDKTLGIVGLGHIGASTARDARGLGMQLCGYDPHLNVENALKIPRSLSLEDSISGVCTKSDYISLNIPYIKGSPAEGGTHGIIDRDIISHMKSDAVLLNFARGELVDSAALKDFLDGGGRYVSDFPDDLLWDHPNAIILPHLGASTAEAEDAAAAMAANTIRDYLEHGTINNSVNFPTTRLNNRPKNAVRVTIVNKNVPGMLAHITEAFGESELNILQQINASRGTVAYNVVDVELPENKDGGVVCFKKLQERITMVDGVLSSNIIYGPAGKGYARNVDGSYFV
uniref:phosphoglycerate dehydrogenase n=1 Tax=Corethron hystrix TaxID=216773 RepID=A0A7S1BYJ6_9STRA|mmetsp:Transcript_6950/g.15014  ORF Transcript_6950/g.15014 Transcript_6950/m.15014 type:complete len:469 (+) Transcript_6950:78-1484(+)